MMNIPYGSNILMRVQCSLHSERSGLARSMTETQQGF